MDQLFTLTNIYTDVEGATFEEVLDNVSKKLDEKGFINEGFKQSVLDREKVFPTGLEFDGYNIAIPHTDSQFVKQDAIAVIKPKNPVIFKDMATNSKELEVGVMLLLLISKNENQVKVLSNIIKSFSDKQFYNDILATNNEEEILKIINTKENN